MITSAANREVRALRRLGTRENRERANVVLVEGRAAVTEVLDAGGTIDRIVVTSRGERALTSLVKRAHAAGAIKVVVSEAIMALLCGTQQPPPVMAVARRPVVESRAGDPFCWLAVDGVRDPGALGAILRTSASFGVGLVTIAPGCAVPFSPKVVRASQAAAWRVAVEVGIAIEAISKRANGEGATRRVLTDGVPELEPLPSKLLLVVAAGGDRLDEAMRLEAIPTQPGLPVALALPVVLADWNRAHRA